MANKVSGPISTERGAAAPDPTLSAKFQSFFDANKEKGYESVSGVGSSLNETRVLRERLPPLFRNLDIRSLIDAPCGDGNWMAHLEYRFDLYVGVDLVTDVIEKGRSTIKRPFHFFETADVTTQVLPRADAILCRDCLVHLSNSMVVRALRNFCRSGSTYLITTHFLDVGDAEMNAMRNSDIQPGKWRPVSLTSAPFLLPEPLCVIDEESKNRFGKGKVLAVWRLSDILGGGAI